MDSSPGDDKRTEYARQGTGAAGATATGAGLKHQADKLASAGGGRDRSPEQARQAVDNPFIQVDRALKRCGYSQDALIEVLRAAQETFGFLGDDTMLYIARELKLPPSWVYGVATFYHFFNLKPQGEHCCTICMGTACFVKRAGDIVEALEKDFSVKAGGTSADGKLSLNIARCLGNCGLAPMVILDGHVHARQTPEEMLDRCRQLVKGERNSGRQNP